MYNVLQLIWKTYHYSLKSKFIVALLSPFSFLKDSRSKTRWLNFVTTQHFVHIFWASGKGQCRWEFVKITLTATYRNMGKFNKSVESWTQYPERLEQYFLANKIEDDKQQRAILLSIYGSKTYGLIWDLLQTKKTGYSALQCKSFAKRWKIFFRLSQVSLYSDLREIVLEGKVSWSSSWRNTQWYATGSTHLRINNDHISTYAFDILESEW